MANFFGKLNPDFPDDLAVKLFSYIDIKTFITVAPAVNKDWNRVINQDPIKKTLFSVLSQASDFANKAPNQIMEIKKLGGGLTNTSIFFATAGKAFVGRRPGIHSDRFIDREAEAYNVAIAVRLGIAAPVAYAGKKGNQITHYLPNPKPMTPELFKDAKNLQKAAHVLKIVHGCSKQFSNDIDVFARNRKMLALLKEKQVALPPAYEIVMETMNKLERLFCALNIKKVPCHNDTTPGNFIKSNGEMKLIDWEYSGNNDPVWDLANTSCEGEFTESQDHQLFLYYFGTWANEAYQRFLLYKPVVELWAALWTWVQIANNNMQDSLENLRQYEQRRFENCKKLLNEAMFKNAYDYVSKLTAPTIHHSENNVITIQPIC
ncbi:phosphotransferase [Aquicella lusitana]|uniref:Thiamine kinase-like enzyme n=1 Tax=Aquicella lusitana TaxID=254246 RepID=A0A370GZQ7_9COXI|nr:phosphotransferase [Aquicella lusitana]RDI48797.1 thiamine kinase-like enzyme [Aquicella lusitana]VVC73225.1 Thiamine kinase [Aquicella lusitana]